MRVGAVCVCEAAHASCPTLSTALVFPWSRCLSASLPDCLSGANCEWKPHAQWLPTVCDQGHMQYTQRVYSLIKLNSVWAGTLILRLNGIYYLLQVFALFLGLQHIPLDDLDNLRHIFRLFSFIVNYIYNFSYFNVILIFLLNRSFISITFTFNYCVI